MSKGALHAWPHVLTPLMRACAGIAQLEAAGDLDEEDSEEEDADFDAGGAEVDESDDDLNDMSDDDVVRLPLHSIAGMNELQPPIRKEI